MSEFTAATWTASELLTSIYRACRLPDSGTIDYPPTVVLTMADEAIHDWGGHLLASARDGRLCTSTLRSLADDVTELNGNEYALPPMAVADSIESIAWLDDSGDECRLQLIPLGMEPMFQRGTEAGRPTCYALRDRTVRVYPRPEARGSLRITYMRRHGQLVIGSDTTTVVSSGAAFLTATAVTLAALPSSFVDGAWVDFVSRFYPYRIKASYPIAAASAPDIVLDVLPAEFAALDLDGDTAVISGKSPFVSLPLEMKGPLVQQIAMQVTAELGDLQLSSGYNTLAKEGAFRVRDMLSPRAKSDRQKLVSPNSLARGRAGGRSCGRWRV